MCIESQQSTSRALLLEHLLRSASNSLLAMLARPAAQFQAFAASPGQARELECFCIRHGLRLLSQWICWGAQERVDGKRLA